MGLQTDDLVMIGRGITDGQTVNPAGQPIMANGNHLRFAFARERGFPWWGFYLFRRLHQGSKTVCAWPQPGAKGSVVQSPEGTWSCPPPAELKLDNSFAPTTKFEFDLRQCQAVQFDLPSGRTTSEVRVKVGLYAGPEDKADGGSGLAGNKGCTWGFVYYLGVVIMRLFLPLRARTVGPIRITSFSAAGIQATNDVSGRPGDVITVTQTGTGIFRTEIQTQFSSWGSCAVIEICYEPETAGLAGGWGQLGDFPYPLCLPSPQADYPCAGKPATAAAARTMARDRVRYGQLTDWDPGDPRFDDISAMLDVLLSDGPAGGAMANRFSSVFAAGAQLSDPHMPSQYPLDLLLLGSLNPAIAQALGLYWVDATAAEQTSYDYIILADHDDSFNGSAQVALTALASGNLPVGVDAYITYDLMRGPAPVLPAPPEPRSYAIPGGTIGAVGVTAPLGTNTAGLTWTLPVAAGGGLLPDSPISYHIWRGYLGPDAPIGPPLTDTLITAGAPIFVADTPGPPPGAPMQFASDWPPFRLFAYDRNLADGWYAYRLRGLDLFGQFTQESAPARWFQWAPVPDPVPWYYSGTGSDAVVNAWAVHLRDTRPPPAPAAVEATVLDPDDPMRVGDGAWDNWYTADWWINRTDAQRAATIGVRVSWKWTPSQQLQAPDTAEFRIYFHPGSTPPGATGRDAADWNARIFVVSYGTHCQTLADGTLSYEVLLPLANGTDFDGIPLAPDNAHTVVYGQIGVSAADNKGATGDDPKWLTPQSWQPVGFGNRTGNESRLGVPATVYRVLRAPPPAPGIVDFADKVWASPADYHSLSYYTVRWPRPSGADAALLDAHVFRAMDETLFEYDFHQRPRQPVTLAFLAQFNFGVGVPAIVKGQLDDLNGLTPTYTTGSDGQVRLANLPAALAMYRQLRTESIRALGSLPDEPGANGKPGNLGAFSQISREPIKHATAPDRIGPDSPATYVPSAALSAYLAELDGRARNAWLFRVAYVNGAHDMGPLGPSSPPVYLQNVFPASPPHAVRALAGDRRITLSWRPPVETGVSRIRIHRADSRRASADIRLYGPPVADLPAVPLVARWGAVDLGAGTQVSAIELVWRASDLLPGEDPLTGGSATQYLLTPSVGSATSVAVNAPDSTVLVVVYRDDRGTLQHTPVPGAAHRWVDDPVTPDVLHHYSLVTVKRGEGTVGSVDIHSPTSAPVTCKAFDTGPPLPSVWVGADWIRLDGTPQENELPFTSTVTPSTAVVKLVWTNSDAGVDLLAQRRAAGGIWENVTGWVADATGCYDRDADPTLDLDYRLRARKPNGLGADSLPINLVHAE